MGRTTAESPSNGTESLGSEAIAPPLPTPISSVITDYLSQSSSER